MYSLQIDYQEKDELRSSRMMFVDLAGSERITIHDNRHNKKIQQETIGINKSLLTLRKVITTLHKL